MPTAYIALGANLGDRGANIRAAVEAIGRLAGTRVTRVSALLETAAVGGPAGAPAFLNGAAEVETELGPRELLAAMLEIERSLGRVREEKWGPRTIDLDLLMYGDAVIAEEGLHVPHPRMHERAFVMGPLAEIAGGVRHPGVGVTIGELAERLSERSPADELGGTE
ncbi:MAG TPA: 2-amino-4-hydroxy-6-hydroxymethyldihydropteridine diphosphokinase [Tepidisphaeraceae bacterium]|nr:2-amino-4-hydroxy-6-hydroxymethyldihydropteridine diphosphokinase [Tepidisphaeraceae bacterium]